MKLDHAFCGTVFVLLFSLQKRRTFVFNGQQRFYFIAMPLLQRRLVKIIIIIITTALSLGEDNMQIASDQKKARKINKKAESVEIK